MAEVALAGVSKQYAGGVQAVRDLTLAAADGELLVLVGPSGCGKTTTLRLIAGLETPTRGSIRIAGRDVTRLPPRERDVAMVFQRPALYPHLSVRDNLAFGLRMRRGWLAWLRDRGSEATVRERVARAARILELEDVLDRLPSQLSGGEQQRVALGRAVVRQPAAFLLDEPLSNLDARLRAEMRRELHLLQRRLAATMIYVTHDQTEAMALGDRVAVLHHGVAQQVAAPLAVYERPANRFVAGFIGWPPMNFLDGELVERDGRPWFTTAGAALPLDGALGWLAHRGRPLTLGVRPEDVRLGPPGRDGLVMETALVEALGSTCVVTLRRDDRQAMAVTGARLAPNVPEKVAVMFDLTKAHLFDRSTGLALAHAGAG